MQLSPLGTQPLAIPNPTESSGVIVPLTATTVSATPIGASPISARPVGSAPQS